MALSAADVGELRRRIQSGEMLCDEAGGKKICGALSSEADRLVKPGNMTPGEKRVYELLRVYEVLRNKSLYGGHGKQFIDSELGVLQEIMEEAEAV